MSSQTASATSAFADTMQAFGVQSGSFASDRDASTTSRLDRTQVLAAGASKRETEELGSESQPTMSKSEANLRKLVVMRHVERMDAVHPSFTLTAFSDMGKFKMNDLNMPVKLPQRNGGPSDYKMDPPITELGNSCGQLTGRGLQLNQAKLTHVLVSPAFRCIQTAHRVLKAYGKDIKICIEPGLFEFLGWYPELPNWMSHDELSVEGYAIDQGYQPVMGQDDLLSHKEESTEEYYERVANVINSIIQRYTEIGTVLVIGHATTVDAGTRALRKLALAAPPEDELETIGESYPFGCMVTVQEVTPGEWRHCHNPVPCITYVDFNNRIDLRTFSR